MAKILITETIHPIGAEKLKAAGHEVVTMETRSETELREKMKDADGMLVRILPIPADAMEQAGNLKIISKHGVGVDNFDLDAAKRLGIRITTAPDANSLSVAEHAFAMLMSLAKNIPAVSEAYRKIGFAAKNGVEGAEISGKTLGIIGCGRIGSRIVPMAADGFGMRVLVYDPYIKKAPEGATLVSDRDLIFRESDFVSLHCPLNGETRHSVGEHEFSLMKKTAVFINCARGPIVDETALIRALQNGTIAGAGLDVTEREPLEPESPLFAMPNVIVTPHYAPTTREAAFRVADIAAENLIGFFRDGSVIGRIV